MRIPRKSLLILSLLILFASCVYIPPESLQNSPTMTSKFDQMWQRAQKDRDITTDREPPPVYFLSYPFFEDACLFHVHRDCDNTTGFYDFDARKIYIRQTPEYLDMESIVMHEMVHSLQCEQYGVEGFKEFYRTGEGRQSLEWEALSTAIRYSIDINGHIPNY